MTRWIRQPANHGLVNFNLVFRPSSRGVGTTHPGMATASSVLEAPSETTASLHLSWDDPLMLRVNDELFDLGPHRDLRTQTIRIPLRAGANTAVIKLSNTLDSTHESWAFAFQATPSAGDKLVSGR